MNSVLAKIWLHVALVVAAAGCADSGSPPLSEEEQEIVDAHNAVRARATPSPSPALPTVSWSKAAASQAQEWASRCVFEHRDPNNLGENLALFSPRDVTPTEVVELWATEADDYDYDANACTGEQCGHYTQIVWRDSVGVGCAFKECDNVAGFGPGILWVCNYDPPGNFVGEKPY